MLNKKINKAIVLLSGGLDSSTTLYYAISKGYKCHALIFDYGQRHAKEVKCAIAIATQANIKHQTINIKLPWKASALLDKKIKLPQNRTIKIMRKGIPVTYVPGRNTIFLAFALSYAESIGAKAIFIGANAIDYSGYPDCRPEFLMAFQLLVNKGARDNKIKIFAPLIQMTKVQILKLAIKLKVPIELTWSCYMGEKKPCRVCDSCLIREKAFASIPLIDYNKQ